MLKDLDRDFLHTVMRRMAIAAPCKSRCHEQCIRWMSQRHIVCTSGVWVLDPRQVERCVTDPSTLPVMCHLEHLDLRYEDRAFDWNLFAACVSLKSLWLVRFRVNGVAHSLGPPLAQPLFPLLEEVFLDNCGLSPDMLMMFCNCERLVRVNYAHGFVDGTANQQALWPFVQRIHYRRSAFEERYATY